MACHRLTYIFLVYCLVAQLTYCHAESSNVTAAKHRAKRFWWENAASPQPGFNSSCALGDCGAPLPETDESSGRWNWDWSGWGKRSSGGKPKVALVSAGSDTGPGDVCPQLEMQMHSLLNRLNQLKLMTTVLGCEKRQI